MTQPSPVIASLRQMHTAAGGTIDALDRWQTHIETALAKGLGLYSFEDVVAQVMNGNFHIQEEPGCFFIWQMQDYPQFSVLHVFLAGGDLDAVVQAVPKMERMAREIGAKKVTMQGRKGWERVFTKIGAVPRQIVMEVDVSDG